MRQETEVIIDNAAHAQSDIIPRRLLVKLVLVWLLDLNNCHPPSCPGMQAVVSRQQEHAQTYKVVPVKLGSIHLRLVTRRHHHGNGRNLKVDGRSKVPRKGRNMIKYDDALCHHAVLNIYLTLAFAMVLRKRKVL